MPYQTINPFTEKLVKTFTEQTDEQLQWHCQTEQEEAVFDRGEARRG